MIMATKTISQGHEECVDNINERYIYGSHQINK
jgi:hypothetical protein